MRKTVDDNSFTVFRINLYAEQRAFVPREAKMQSTKKSTSNRVVQMRKSAAPKPFKLVSIYYSEWQKDPREWVLEESKLGEINLLVGKNAAGKSRMLNVINGLAKLINGEFPKVFESGQYKICLASEDTAYIYDLSIENSEVVKESLSKNGKNLLERGRKGVGKIWAEKINQKIEFESPPDQLAAKVRRDAIQHPYFEDLHNWAILTRHFAFGTPLGRDFLTPITQSMTQSNMPKKEISNTGLVGQIYLNGFNEFGDKFDAAILKDLKLLGYSCTDVGANGQHITGIDGPVIMLQVKEKDIKSYVTQLTMSQGMFRALSLVIQLNYIIFRKVPRTILIDDIGEGLDFSRSQAFVSLLIKRAKTNKIQLIMTTNDRFIMNGVALEHIGIIDRSGQRVRVINKQNSPTAFDEYEDLGLNNFDFFAGNYFKHGSDE